jgi:hypothetical protein
MISSGEINGAVHASKHLIDILKTNLGLMELLFLTGRYIYTYTRHKVAENNRQL